jgi:hypothetical protein
MQMQVAFSDGFADDTAVIRVDGAEAWRADGLTTRTQISHAGSAEVEAGDGSLVEVEVPTQGLSAELERQPYVVVAVAEDGLQVSYPEQLGFA